MATTTAKTHEQANALVENKLNGLLKEIEQHLHADVIYFAMPLLPGSDDRMRVAIESKGRRRKSVFVILETGGGYIEVAERMVNTLRHHYSRVSFIVPNYAMSAGTVLVMSGDQIWMDYYSVLGPIDPQVNRPDGSGWVPALGYLEQYNRLIEKSKTGDLTTAEVTFLIEKFDPAELYAFEQARNLSVGLLREWLQKYKFKNWKITETKKIKVTRAIREKRAVEIAVKLNQTKRWGSHGRGISMLVLRRDLKLKIDDLGADKPLARLIKSYYNLLGDYMEKMGQKGVVHVLDRYRAF